MHHSTGYLYFLAWWKQPRFQASADHCCQVVNVHQEDTIQLFNLLSSKSNKQARITLNTDTWAQHQKIQRWLYHLWYSASHRKLKNVLDSSWLGVFTTYLISRLIALSCYPAKH
jgi:hypothetical protein